MIEEYGTYKIQFPGNRPEGGVIRSFLVFGQGDNNTAKTFPSYDEAATWIDRQDAAKEKTKRRKLNLPVISDKGVKSTITGIHASHGRVLTSPDITDRYGSTLMLPPVPWIEEAQAELKRTRDHAERIEECLRLFAILPCDKFDTYNESKHEQYVTAIETNHAAMTAKAIERDGLKLETLETPKTLRV